VGEAFVQVAPDSTGKKVRNIQLDLPQADGSITTVQMQVVSIRDENGTPIATTASSSRASTTSCARCARCTAAPPGRVSSGCRRRPTTLQTSDKGEEEC